MKAFAAGELQVLVSTTVVEVGIDVPNATVMLIEHAERFGLRSSTNSGRVGAARTSRPASDAPVAAVDEARERLKAMTDTTDGFEIAGGDLRLRGPGDLFGTRQAGMPTFRLIDLIRDHELLEMAQHEAARWFETTAPPAEEVARLLDMWGERFKLIDVG